MSSPDLRTDRPPSDTDSDIDTGAEPGLPARALALDLVSGMLRRNRQLDDLLAAGSTLERRDRAFARAIAAATLRRLGQIDALLAATLEHPIAARDWLAEDVLRIGIAQLLFLGTPPHAAVNSAVAQMRGRKPRFAALVNAVLRRLAREGAAMVAAQDAARLNTPDWLWQGWAMAFGEATARAIAEAHLQEPPLDLSVKTDAADWAATLGGEVLPTGGLRLPMGGAIGELPGYEQGAWWVQDAAAALPARLLGEVRGHEVIDLCAAPGGKTMQLAAGGAKVVAVDISAKRLARVRENLERLGLAAALIEADAARWRPAQIATRVLLDAPCSATGTIRRHPDIARLKTPNDVARLTQTQDRLLANATAMLGPGGVLVYAVCSLQPEEGPQRIADLLARETGLARVPIRAEEIGGLTQAITPDGDLRTLPCFWAERGGMDGFYAARLIRR